MKRMRVNGWRAVLGFLTAGLIIGLTQFSTATPSARADANATLKWLSEEPVTLMDLGIIRLQRHISQAAHRLRDTGYLPVLPLTGAYFEWRDGKIVAYMTARERFANPQEGKCVELFLRVARMMTENASGQKGNASWYLEEIFTHEGWGNITRPQRLRDELLQSVQLEITLLPPRPFGQGQAVNCKGPFDAAPEQLNITHS